MQQLTHSEKSLFRYIQSDKVSDFIAAYESSDYVRKNACNSEKITFLGEAVKRSALKIANYLLKEPGRMNELDGNKNKAISYIGVFGSQDAKTIELFRDNGLDFSKSIGVKGNMLHVISPRGDKSLFNQIVSYGANPDGLNSMGMSPLSIAKRWNNTALIEHIEKNYSDDGIDLAV